MEEGCSNLWLWTAVFNSPLTTLLSTQASWQLNICISPLSALTLLKLLCCSTPALWSLSFLPLDAIQNTGQIQSRAEDAQLLPSRVWHSGFEEERSWPLPSPSASASFHTSWVHQMPFSSESWGSPLLDPTFPYANRLWGGWELDANSQVKQSISLKSLSLHSPGPNLTTPQNWDKRGKTKTLRNYSHTTI